jgi:murein DD-endopeptidase MepM/ murein hydrolase activator NlpD
MPLRPVRARALLLPVSAVLAIAAVSAATLPAFAEALDRTAYDTASQHLALAASTTPVVPAPRDGVTVTVFTPVQWPIDPATEVSSPFGPRIAPCAGCSTMHSGVDLVPGEGTPIAAVAEGTVVEAGFFGDLGQHVMIRHEVDGETVTSVYGHMIAGSSPLHVGDHIAMGQLVGEVGDTGESTGAHLHFGILDASGAPEDPLAWMTAHVTQPWG